MLPGTGPHNCIDISVGMETEQGLLQILGKASLEIPGQAQLHFCSGTLAPSGIVPEAGS